MHFLIIMNILWGGSYAVMKWGMAYLAPMHLLFIRMLVSLIIISIFSIKMWQGMRPQMIVRCAILGAILAIAHGFGVTGIDKSQSVDGALLYAMEPIVAIIYARILLKERMDVWRGMALVLALVGFVVLSNITADNLLSNLIFLGNILILVGTFADGAFSSVAKPVVKEYQARIVLAVLLFFATLYLLPFALGTPVRPTSFSWQAAASIFYLSVICTSVGWTLWLALLKKHEVNVIALTVFVQPVVGPFVSHFMLGEEISARVWFGGGIILVAVLIAVLKRKKTETEIIAEAVIH